MKNEHSQIALNWLKEKVFPLWMNKGVDSANGAFVESLTFEGQPQSSARRALVQARQMYSFIEGYRLGVIDLDSLKLILEKSVPSYIKIYSTPLGAFFHSADINEQPVNKDLDLYTQGFALFGLAHAYEILKDEKAKQQAFKILQYLYSERSLENGGFSEIKNSVTLHQANPHMHLFEAALAWTKIDSDPRWRKLSDELYQLCITKFIDPETGFLAEHFDENWHPLRENGYFIFEPGHHYEWAWLMMQYQAITSVEVGGHPKKLFELAERFGLDAEKKLAYDEVLSDRSVKKMSSRFWPQCERIKAAVVLGQPQVATTAMKALFANFIVPNEGLWRDTILENGQFDSQPAKASSLYHIINAISEYARYTKV